MSKDKNKMNYGVVHGVSYVTVEDNPDYKQGRVANEIEATIWGVKPIHGETRYVLNPEHRNNEFTSMLFQNINIIPVNIMVGLLETFNENINRDLRGIYKITIEKLEEDQKMKLPSNKLKKKE